MKFSAVKVLIGANVAVFLLWLVVGPALEIPFALWPLQRAPDTAPFAVWQLVTYAFLHGGFTHILFNMWGLWLFGSERRS